MVHVTPLALQLPTNITSTIITDSDINKTENSHATLTDCTLPHWVPIGILKLISVWPVPNSKHA